MARIASAAGTRLIVATPHNGAVIHPPELLFELVVHFNAALRHHGIELMVLVGAENVFNLGCDVMSRYCINDTRYLLVEFPHTHLPNHASEIIFELLKAGLFPIIVHPERNPSIVREPKLLLELVAQGALAQITAESLTGTSGSAVKNCARFLLKQGGVHFLASDGHSSTRRPPILSGGLKVATKLIGRQEARKLVTDNPKRVLDGKPWPI